MENSVGKLAAPQCWAPNASTGKRAWRTPIPHLVPVRPKGGAGTLCFKPQKIARIDALEQRSAAFTLQKNGLRMAIFLHIAWAKFGDCLQPKGAQRPRSFCLPVHACSRGLPLQYQYSITPTLHHPNQFSKDEHSAHVTLNWTCVFRALD